MKNLLIIVALMVMGACSAKSTESRFNRSIFKKGGEKDPQTKRNVKPGAQQPEEESTVGWWFW